VATQTPAITDASLAEARRLAGYYLRAQRGVLEITRQAIRRYTHAMGSENPLFTDEAYARQTRWGGLIAPPYMLNVVGDYNIGPGLRGIQWVYGGADWEWYRPIRVGDVITSRGRLLDAVEKRGEHVPRFIIQVGEITYWNQRDELVGKVISYMMRTPRARASGGMDYKPRVQTYTPERIQALEEEALAAQVRGSRPRYWEDTQPGEPVPPLVYGPLRMADIALLGGRRDNRYSDGAHVYQVLHRRQHPADTYIDPATGVQDHPHRGHWEQFMAAEVGMPGVYDVGPQRLSWLCRLLCDWMGDDGLLKRLSARLRRPNVVGDTTWLRGRVKDKRIEKGEHVVDCEVWGENQVKEVTVAGTAVVALPSRSLDDTEGGHR